jgi:hypothetical protein
MIKNMVKPLRASTEVSLYPGDFMRFNSITFTVKIITTIIKSNLHGVMPGAGSPHVSLIDYDDEAH